MYSKVTNPKKKRKKKDNNLRRQQKQKKNYEGQKPQKSRTRARA